jgi:hypothetical protein
MVQNRYANLFVSCFTGARFRRSRDGLLNLVAGELVAKSRDARVVQVATAELELRVLARAAFEELSISNRMVSWNSREK